MRSPQTSSDSGSVTPTRTVGDDYSMLKKNVKFRKEIANRIGVGFELPDSILAPVVPNVPKTSTEQAQQVMA